MVNVTASVPKGKLSERAKRMNASMRKRRTRQHIIADLSANHVERHVLLCGHTLERFQYDYGVDLMLFTYTANGEPEQSADLRAFVIV